MQLTKSKGPNVSGMGQRGPTHVHGLGNPCAWAPSFFCLNLDLNRLGGNGERRGGLEEGLLLSGLGSDGF